MSKIITAEVARELLDYDPETGILTWRPRAAHWFVNAHAFAVWNTRFAGTEAGYKDRSGYVQVGLFGRKHWAHRLAWLIMTDEFPPVDTDHADRNRGNNTWVNLRAVSTAENMQNQPKRCDNTSGVTGVHWHVPRERWYVGVGQTYVGCFKDFDEAVAARLAEQAAQGYHENHGKAL